MCIRNLFQIDIEFKLFKLSCSHWIGNYSGVNSIDLETFAQSFPNYNSDSEFLITMIEMVNTCYSQQQKNYVLHHMNFYVKFSTTKLVNFNLNMNSDSILSLKCHRPFHMISHSDSIVVIVFTYIINYMYNRRHHTALKKIITFAVEKCGSQTKFLNHTVLHCQQMKPYGGVDVKQLQSRQYKLVTNKASLISR